MDQLDEITERVNNMRTTATSRTDTSVELGYVHLLVFALSEFFSLDVPLSHRIVFS